MLQSHIEMNFYPKISVIIPTYNRSKYLIKIITKIANSRIRNEIIICDSNSKDQTKEKIKKIQSDHKNQIIRYINKKTKKDFNQFLMNSNKFNNCSIHFCHSVP